MADHVQEIKERLDIVEIVSDYVRLKKVGKNFRGLCPFHNEKTPSFYVSQERQTYHCFGCGHGGDVFSFIMEIENLQFREALEVLAKRAGVELEDTRKEIAKRSLYDIMELSCSFYRQALSSGSGEIARKYLKKRNMSMEMASSFEIGWSPSSWDSLWSFLKNKGVSSNDALKCGLVLEGKRDFYDRFRGRLIFPIRDITGKLMAFGGRLVDGEGAKYINSPESSLYSKRRNLYLLRKAKKKIREKGRIILVEGYMDAIRLHLSGFDEAVASLGTSLTEEQASLIKRLGDTCYICYDSDAAGQEATIRGMYILQEKGLDVRVVDIPEGKDPDELLSRAEGKEIFEQSIGKARPLVLYHLFSVRKKNATDLSGATEEFLESISQLPFETVAPYINYVSRELGVLPHILQERLSTLRKSMKHAETPGAKNSIQHYTRKETTPEMDPLQAAMIALLWNDPELRRTQQPKEIFPLFSDEMMRTLAAALLSGEDPVQLEKGWLALGDTFPNRVVAAGGLYVEQFSDRGDTFSIIKESLERKRKIGRYKVLKEKLIKMEASEKELREYSTLSSELKDVVF